MSNRPERRPHEQAEVAVQDGATTAAVKEQVRQFYESVGWRQIGEGLYQNARYEDLRPVSAEYLRRCHRRVARHLPAEGRYLLDAGSGPIQYPEYLEYSNGFDYRVCLDISHRALREARERLGERGLYVVGDVARLPFAGERFEGVVSLHTVHHLPPDEHRSAFQEFFRTLQPAGRCAVVYSWGSRSGLMRLAQPLLAAANWGRRLYARLRGRGPSARDGQVEGPTVMAHASDQAAAERGSGRAADPNHDSLEPASGRPADGGTRAQLSAEALLRQPGTYTFKHGYRWIHRALADLPGLEIRVWRSVSTQFLRALIHPQLQGRRALRLLYWLEERLPHFLGRHGQYPLILFHQPGRLDHAAEPVSQTVGARI